MTNTIKENKARYQELLKYKKSHNVPPYRATGRSTRELFDMASRYPHGQFIHINHSTSMARHNLEKFVLMLTTMGAPVMSINKSRLIVKLPHAEYKFAVDSDRLRADMRPDDQVFEDHHVQEERNARFRRRLDAEREYTEKEEARKASNYWRTT